MNPIQRKRELDEARSRKSLVPIAEILKLRMV
jgi:hypothetical protein